MPLIMVVCTHRPEIIEYWLEKNGPDDNSKESRAAIADASAVGELNLVQEYMLHTAAVRENDTCLKYLCEVQGWDILADKRLLQYAFDHASLPNVMYLTEKGALNSFYYINKREYGARDDARYDADLLACIQYAVAHGWKYNINLYNFILQRCGEKDTKMRLPLCKAYVQAENWKLIVDQQMAQYASNK
eukprot:gene10075-11806_t